MVKFLPAVLSILICCIVYTVGFTFIPSFKERKKEYIKNGIVFTVIAVASAFLLSILISSTTLFEKAPSAYSGAIAGSSCFFGFVVSRFVSSENFKKFLKRIGYASLAVFILECTVFNFHSFTTDDTNYKADMSAVVLSEGNELIPEEDAIKVSADSTITIPVNSDKIHSVALEFQPVKLPPREDGKPLGPVDYRFKCILYMADDNFSVTPAVVGNKMVSATYDKPLVFPVNSYGEISNISFSIGEYKNPFLIKSITLSSAVPFEFSDTRFYFLIAVVYLIIAIISFGLYKVTYNKKSRLHSLIIVLLAGLCAYSVTVFDITDELPVEYTSETDITYSDPYVQMFDSIQKDRFSIDVEPTPELLAIDNPYDLSKRTESGAAYLWDRAFYDGEYYSYYGITPVLLYYIPYYHLFDDVPTMNTTCQFFGALAILFMFGAIMAFVNRFIKKPNMLLLLLSLASSCLVSGIYFSVNLSNQYIVPSVVSTCFLMLCLWCGVSACSCITKKKSILLFIISGISFILCLSARPSKSISALVLAPLFIAVLVSRDITIRKKLLSVSAFIVPIVIGLSAVMWYNYARFDSPFDFGQTYQLTVSNVNANGINPTLFPSAMLRYFLQPVDFIGDFPYIGYNTVQLTNHGQYVYDASSFGVLSLPMILLATVLMPVLVWHTRHRKTTPWRYNENRIRNYTYVLMLVLSVLIAFMDYCMAGIVIDYINDFLPILMLMSILVFLEIQSRAEKFPVITNKVTLSFSVAIIASAAVFFAIILTMKDYSLYKHAPNILTELENLICFWH